MSTGHTYWIGLGANLGDPPAALRAALGQLERGGDCIEAVSPLYRTAPRDLEDQPPFYNAAARIGADRPPPAMLAHLKRIERTLGRDPGGVRFGPRAIDCDILVWSGGPWSAPDLVIPHPRLAERRFALAPLCDLDPELEVAGLGPAAALLAAIDPAEQPATRLEGERLWPAA